METCNCCRFQEIVPLNAGNVLRQENNDISMKWNSLIKAALGKSMLPEERLQKADVGEIQRIYPLKTHRFGSSGAPEYECVVSKQMVGIFITIWVRKVLLGYISHPSVSTVGCGVLGCLRNKVITALGLDLGKNKYQQVKHEHLGIACITCANCYLTTQKSFYPI